MIEDNLSILKKDEGVISQLTLDQGSKSLLHMVHKQSGLVWSGNLIQQNMLALLI